MNPRLYNIHISPLSVRNRIISVQSLSDKTSFRHRRTSCVQTRWHFSTAASEVAFRCKINTTSVFLPLLLRCLLLMVWGFVTGETFTCALSYLYTKIGNILHLCNNFARLKTPFKLQAHYVACPFVAISCKNGKACIPNRRLATCLASG